MFSRSCVAVVINTLFSIHFLSTVRRRSTFGFEVRKTGPPAGRVRRMGERGDEFRGVRTVVGDVTGGNVARWVGVEVPELPFVVVTKVDF
jgi:hypothetical protein